jgi:hypothetical protein
VAEPLPPGIEAEGLDVENPAGGHDVVVVDLGQLREVGLDRGADGDLRAQRQLGLSTVRPLAIAASARRRS